MAKQLAFLREMVPRAARVVLFVNPANIRNLGATEREAPPSARALGLELKMLRASTAQEIDAGFATFAGEPADALFLAVDGFFAIRRAQFVQQAAHNRLPALYPDREYVEMGGLMSYASNIAEAFRQAGVYAGRLLKGAKPADLPVIQSSKFEFVINLNTAKAFNLSLSPGLLAIADEVIE